MLHVLLDGSNIPILKTVLPNHSALYSNIRTKLPHAKSLIACASLWFLITPWTFNVSSATAWFSLISLIETLFGKSLR